MDKEKAKEVLRRTRPWSRHTSEEEEEAAKAAERDPALSKFREEQQEFNARVRQELASIPVPKGLRDQILARRKVVDARPWLQPKRLLPLAAALAVLGVGLFYWNRPSEDTSVAGFRSRMVGFAVREYRMDLFTKDFPELKGFLASKASPDPSPLPARLANTPLKGGASLSWQGRKVSMVCFDWQGKDTLYMFVLDQSLANGEISPLPNVETVKNLTTATWKSDGKIFLLAGRISETALADLIKS